MDFCSPLFLFLFLPLTLGGYWCLAARWRPGFLLVASIGFYVSSSVFYNASAGKPGGSEVLWLLAYYWASCYLFGLALARAGHTRRGRLALAAVLAELAPLVWFKYGAMFHLEGAPVGQVPLGLSFLSFQAVAYLLDVCHEQIEPQTSPLRLGLFLSLFPKLAAGPIIRYRDVAAELVAPVLSRDGFVCGVKRFSFGLGKKVLLADTLARTADQVFSLPAGQLPAGVAWLGLVCYALELFLDFSGYSDMALGLGLMFGFRLPENFNYPYVARSLTDFWRRWHISLSSWFRDYLFLPLSRALMTERARHRLAQGNYRSNYRVRFSIVAVFALCGLWHGAGWNYVAWGTLHGVVLASESTWFGRALKRLWPPLQHAYLLAVVFLSWVLFRVATPAEAFDYLAALAGLSRQVLPMAAGRYLDTPVLLALVAGGLATLPLARVLEQHLMRRGQYALCAFCEAGGLAVVILLSLCSIASSTFTPFLYQQF